MTQVEIGNISLKNWLKISPFEFDNDLAQEKQNKS